MGYGIGKTKEQLVEELAETQRRIAELEISEVERKKAEEELRIATALDRVRLATYRMREASDIQEVLVSLYEALKDIGVDFEDCSVQIVDEREESFGIAWQAQHKPFCLDASQKIPVAPTVERNGAVYEAWRNKRAIYRRNLAEEDPYNERAVIRNAYGEDIRSVLDVPFPQGTIAINHMQPDAFSEVDIRTLERFAQVLSEAFIRFEDIRGVTESEERYRSIVEHSQDVIFRIDPAGNYLLISPVIEELTGYPPKDFYADWRIKYQIILPEDIDKLEESMDKASSGETSRDVEYRARKTDGTILWMSQTTFPVQDSEGRVVALEGVIRDITGRKQAEEELRKHRDHLEELVEKRTAELTEANKELHQAEEAAKTSALKWQATFDAIGDAVCLLDMEGTILQCNQAMMDLLGRPSSEIIGRTCWELAHATSEPIEDCPIVRMRETRQRESLILPMGDRWFSVVADPLLDEAGSLMGAVHIASDITERKRMEEELLKVQKLESVGMLAGGIAHDFNNILTAIMGNISLARTYGASDRISEKLIAAEKASLRAKDLTQQLLTFSRGGAPIRIICSIAGILRPSTILALSGSDIRGEFSIPDDLWPVNIDKGQIGQVVSNLVVNARQAMSEGGTITVRAENVIVRTEDALPLEDGEYVKISIEDQGMGIPEEDLQKIFDPYFTTKQRSSGLGLAASYSIVKNHDGYITAESQVGIGTTFHIYLPATPQEILVREEKAEERLAIGEGRILIMDDEDMIREVASDMLDSIGYEVTTATDGDKAIELYREARESGNPFDIVILDLTVAGGMGGKTAIQKLIEVDPEAKAIVSSGYSDDPIMADFRKYGFKGVIAKPYKVQELNEVLQKVIMDTSN